MGRGPPADVRTDVRTDGRTVAVPSAAAASSSSSPTPPPPYRTARNAAAAGNHVAVRSAYLGSGRMIFLLARAAGVHLLFSMAIR